MKINIEIPVRIDGPLDSDEWNELKEHLKAAATPVIQQFAAQKFGPGARMLDTVCRFAFGEPIIKVE